MSNVLKILKSSRGNPCTCPEGKLCKGCKNKKTVKPLIYIEEPRRLSVPITIERYRTPRTTVQLLQKARRWTIQKKDSPVKPTFCSWYKKRKARLQLKRENQKETRGEKEERLDKARRDREKELLEQLEALERLRPTKKSIRETQVFKASPVLKTKPKTKEKRLKTRTAVAKPRAGTKSVSVKHYHRYESLSNRFVNFCYRICCQFYCYMSCIFIIGFVVIYFL